VVPNDLSEDEYMAMLRERLRELTDDGVQEEYLIQSLLLAVDRFVDRQGDSRLHSDQGDKFREFIQSCIDDQRCIDDPDQRHSYRTSRASQRTTYEDDEAVTDLHRVLKEHP
jgi:hypothetical protein